MTCSCQYRKCRKTKTFSYRASFYGVFVVIYKEKELVSGVLSSERQTLIKNEFLEKKKLSVSELAAAYNVSFETIRRDLRVLEKEGFIEKAYGGAMLKQRVHNTADFQMLSNVLVETKMNIAKAAVPFIHPGDCIYIDFSTTCVHIATLLENMPLTVLTNSLPVMEILSKKDKISLYSCGGAWDPTNYAFLGRTALDNLAQFHLDKSFISCRAIGIETGLSDKTELEAEVRKRVIDSSNEVFLLVDHTKFDKMTFVKTAEIKSISTVITDTPLSNQWISHLNKLGVRHYDCTQPPDPPDIEDA